MNVVADVIKFINFDFVDQIFQDSEFQEQEMCDLQSKLKHTMIDAEESKQTEIKEPLQQKAGEDILEALSKVSRECWAVFCFLFIQPYA